MQNIDFKQVFETASRHHRGGRLDQAEALYRRILAADPSHVGALHCLGIAAAQRGEYDAAENLVRRALALAPDYAEAHYNLGIALKALSRLDEAVTSYRQAVALKPDFVAAHNNLGNALQAQSRLEEAAASFRRALSLKPDFVEASSNLGLVLQRLGRLDEAAESCHRALALNPGYPEAHNNLGLVLIGLGRFEDAMASCRRALALKPELIEAYNNLGLALKNLRRLEEAEETFRRALALKPDYVEAQNNLGGVLKDQGRLDDAIESYRRALALRPDFAAAHTNLIFAFNFDSRAGPEAQWQERVRWYEQHARRFTATTPHFANGREPDRQLRIGYVSGHFRRHAATYAFAPMLLHHDTECFEATCYSDTIRTDDLTRAFRDRVERWRDTFGWSDDRLAEAIRADEIDILVDLVGHMSGNRLLVFARKPAPIQATGWGEPTGTGLRTMDYLLADPVLVPPEHRGLLAEQVVDLPGFLGYWTPDTLPEPGSLPALENGYITFGSFNRMTKISDTVLRCWAAILRALPNAHLVLKNAWLDELSRQARVRAVLGAEGVAPDRLTLLGHSDRMAHFAAYQMLDVALDPFPHGGGMTTLDALWMGVPVIAAPGPTISSRLAAASLAALGLTDFIAPDRIAYVALAVDKAADLGALARLRQELRGRLACSAIGDPVRYVGAVEAAYRAMWRRWCATQNAHVAMPPRED